MAHFLEPLLGAHAGPFQLQLAESGRVLASTIVPAFDSRTRKTGLLGQRDWPERTALVLAPCSAIHTCFMRMPIDVIFVDRQGRVRRTCEGLKPWRVAAAWRAFAVIEVRAGTVASVGLALSDTLNLCAP